MMFGITTKVFKEILFNGLVILVLPRHDIPKVCFHMFYNVGSKHEGSALWDEAERKWVNESGIAHFIEHMIFKGTYQLSESDINEFTARVSGSCNAFTSFDYTGYLFEVPSQYWSTVMPIMADCMQNCTFKQEHINSELKAVIQEIKMYNDDYVSTLIEYMFGAIFDDHPYRRPIIGYKRDLWNLQTNHLFNFYKKHYGPNNAVLVVVGDVQPEEIFKSAKEHFGSIPPIKNYVHQAFTHDSDILNQNVVLYRDVQQPVILYCWEIPGSRSQKEYIFDLMSWIVGAGKGSRLYNKLVTEKGIATEAQSFVYDLFDQSLFFIYVQPRSLDDVEEIRSLILEEINNLAMEEISDQELERARKKTLMDFINLKENIQKQGYLIGKNYLISSDENAILKYCDYPIENLKNDIRIYFENFFRPSRMHTGKLLPLSEKDKELWTAYQQYSDQEDALKLGAITREEQIEPPRYANTVDIVDPYDFNYPHAEKFVLSNGLKVLHYNKPGAGKIDVLIDLKPKHYYDPVDKQGLGVFVTDLLQEGTQKYDAQQLALELESAGMELNTFPGHMAMTMLHSDAKKGLDLLCEVLTHPRFEEVAIERIRTQLLTELKVFWDTPREFAAQSVREIIYKNHPYSRNAMGTIESIKKITREDIINAHKKYITPESGRIVLVGDLTGYDIKELLESTLGGWQGEAVAEVDFPELIPIQSEEFNYTINRDQVVLCYAGLSVTRFDEDFDKLLLFDQKLTGGVLGSMNSYLFDLREQTGLFYTIGGSLIAGANKQPGMVYLKTIVSNDRLAEAEAAIEMVIQRAIDNFTQEELEESQRALINSLVDNFESNRQTAAAFNFIDKYGFSDDYFDTRIQQLKSVTLDEVKTAVKKYVDVQKLIKVRIGRVVT